jgi:hypothetical protein
VGPPQGEGLVKFYPNVDRQKDLPKRGVPNEVLVPLFRRNSIRFRHGQHACHFRNKSDRAIAAELGIDHKTVSHARKISWGIFPN